MAADTIICRTPTPDSQPTGIDRWKFDTVRRAILASLPADGDGFAFKELAARVKAYLDPGTLARLGSVGWYTTTVKLELEVRGEIARVAGPGAQRLLRTVDLANAASAAE